jgi:hypothetical protein
MYKLFFTCFIFLVFQQISFAQDTLPKISVTELGRKVLISWQNPFTNVTNIVVQRSNDSLKGFKTIGTVINITATSNGFVDNEPSHLIGNYYRLFITLSGGSYIFTKSHRPTFDTSAMPMQRFEIQEPIQTWFVPSKYIYTDKKNQVIISIPEPEKKKYSIKFFDTNNEFLFEIKRIKQDYLILDKTNFIHSGLFNFEIYDNRILIDRDKLYIPKDGKPMPALDINGHEVN